MGKEATPPSPSGSTLPWQKVDISLPGEADEFETSYNHYDDPNANPADLDYDDGGATNDPGIFVGLEVLDGSMYSVKTTTTPDGSVFSKLVLCQRDHAHTAADSIKVNERNPFSLTKNQKHGTDATDLKVTSDSCQQRESEKNTKKKSKLKAKRELAKLKKKRQREEQSMENEGGKEQPKTKKPSITNKKDDSADNNNDQNVPTLAEIEQIRSSWSASAGGIWLHSTICAGLASLRFTYPTPIQASTLPAAIMGQRDIVGAAPTGSGKTLAYVIPILQYLWSQQDHDSIIEHTKTALQALILCPTRELALQVTKAIVCVGKVKCATIVGGLAEQKQKRILDVNRPPIVVATPGRLWELISSKEHSHLMNLTQLRFLVIDEADRMIRQGSFPQLAQIFEAINRANPLHSGKNNNADDEDDDDPDRLRSLQGIKGEAKVEILDERILQLIDQQSKTPECCNKYNLSNNKKNQEEEKGGLEARTPEGGEDYAASEEDDEDEHETKSIHRQTFVFSATLTLPPSSHHNIKSPITEFKKGRKKSLSVDSAIAEILEKAGARGQTKVVDLSSSNDYGLMNAKVADKSEKKGLTNAVLTQETPLTVRLPPGLSLYQILCTQKHKDSHLYAYLATTKQGSSGPCLVFCNSIGAVKRVAETLRVLGLPAKALHAQLPQKARFGALESLRSSNSRSIVVATDIAARGLDIASVATIVHYDVARAIDTFIHRAGRTARGMGKNAVGTSISLVSSSEEKDHQKICEAVLGSKKLDQVPIDGRLLAASQERVALATKIVICDGSETRTRKKNQWFVEAADAAGLEMDDDLLDEGLAGGDIRDKQRLVEAQRAKVKLRELLAQPMRKQHFGKFLTGAGLAEAIRIETEVKPFLLQTKPSGSKMTKRKPKKQIV